MIVEYRTDDPLYSYHHFVCYEIKEIHDLDGCLVLVPFADNYKPEILRKKYLVYFHVLTYR